MKKTVLVLLQGAILPLMLAQLSCCVGWLQAQNVMGGAMGDPSALLDLQSNSRGLLIPRMSSEERSAITNPAAGLMIYNTSLGCVELNIGNNSPEWICLTGIGNISELDCGSVIFSDPFMVGVFNSRTMTIAYAGGNGSIHNGQEVSSTGVSGLTARLLPGAFASGSGNLTYLVTGIPSVAGTAYFDLRIGGQSCTLEVTVETCGALVSAGEWKEFMCQNLGADTNADPLMPSWELIGNYYQWGRNPSCFGRDGIDAPNPCSSPVYGAAGPWGNTTANDNSGYITGWSYTIAPNDAWQDAVKTPNDPCPAGFRVPTLAQWLGVNDENLNDRKYVGTWTYSDVTNYASGLLIGTTLLLPAAGSRYYGGALEEGRDYFGRYWSSTVSGESEAFYLHFQMDFPSIEPFPSGRIFGLSIRCVKE